MKLVWSALAYTDRLQIFDYIEADSPQAAVLVDERIQSQVEQLIHFPESGRIGRVEGTRELVIVTHPISSRIASRTNSSSSFASSTEHASGPAIQR